MESQSVLIDSRINDDSCASMTNYENFKESKGI